MQTSKTLTTTPPESENAAHPRYRIDDHKKAQVSFGAARSEIEWLHQLEDCYLLREAADRKLRPPRPVAHLLTLWREHGREHPARLRRALAEGRLEYSESLVIFLEWSYSSTNVIAMATQLARVNIEHGVEVVIRWKQGEQRG